MWRFALLSKGEILTKRCTPFSPFRYPKANSPSISNVTVFTPATSPSWKLSSRTLYPCFSAHMMYILISIDAQSQLSVPPAPAVIWRTAESSSPSLESIFLNSRFSIFSRSFGKMSSTSFSLSGSSLENSTNTCKSSNSLWISSYSSTHFFLERSCFRKASASFGLSQNSGEAVFSSSLDISTFFRSI